MRQRGGSFRSDESGAVAATYAIALMGLIMVAGVGFDYARLATMDSELQNGADQAALAGATQLDGEVGACARASQAALELVSNITIMANDGEGNAITIQDEPVCDQAGMVRFYQDEDRTPANSDANAHFIELWVDARVARYALTPIMGAVSSGQISAAAMAGLGSSICKVPPLMICSPDPSQPFNAAAKKGWGIQATGHGGSAWGPGDFGFLEVGAGQTQDLEKALAFVETTFDCVPIEGTEPETGNAQGLFRAINTRFDIYEDNGQPLSQCRPGGKCPAARNVVKDLVKANTNTNGNNACRIHNNGWKLPANQFSPGPRNAATETATTQFDQDGLVDAMGLPRDLCHYNSYVNGVTANRCNNLTGLAAAGGDPNSRYGNGNWARRDYFAKNHPSVSFPPAVGAEYLMDSTDSSSFTRFGVYKWELAQSNIPNGVSGGANGNQYGSPICSTGSAGAIDRRVLTVAIVKNCADLAGGSVPVEVDEWIEAFLVEPTFDGRGNGAGNDTLYVEVIGPATVGQSAGTPSPQTIRRDVPYLVR